MNKNSKIKGSLIGGAIGDALGYQIEFKRNIKEKEVTKFKFGEGIISDDTQMSLFTANALLYRDAKNNTLSYSDAIYEAYLDWLDTQDGKNLHESISWIKDVKELHMPQAPGYTCISALSSGTKGTIKYPLNNSKGCGGIMRVAPIGLYMQTPTEAGYVSAEASAITHGHPLGIIPAYVFSTLIWYLSNTTLSLEEALDKSMKQYKEKFNIYDETTNDYFISLVNRAIRLSKENISDIEAINELGEGWVAEETFAIAIYSCLKYKDSFEDAVICSVNHDGDSDSTGAVTGNIMGAYLGYDAIPSHFKDNVQLKDIILELAEDLSKTISVENNDINWIDKYIYAKNDTNKSKIRNKI